MPQWLCSRSWGQRQDVSQWSRCYRTEARTCFWNGYTKQDKMDEEVFFFLFPSAGVSLKLVRSITTLLFPSLAIKWIFTGRRHYHFQNECKQMGIMRIQIAWLARKALFTHYCTKLVYPSVFWHGNSHVFHIHAAFIAQSHPNLTVIYFIILLF